MILFILLTIIIYFIIKYTQYLFIKKLKIDDKKTLLLIAHPDDETMFFSPLIFNKKDLFILCLSHGNYNKLGNIRKKEFSSLCIYNKIKHKILDKFIDNEDWIIENIVKEILEIRNVFDFDQIITFDEYGVSGHKNHISCYYAAKKLSKKIDCKYLVSFNIFRKYFIFTKIGFPRNFLIFGSNSWLKGFYNMVIFYRSQMLWFRYLYLIFSSYMIVNVYRK